MGDHVRTLVKCKINNLLFLFCLYLFIYFISYYISVSHHIVCNIRSILHCVQPTHVQLRHLRYVDKARDSLNLGNVL